MADTMRALILTADGFAGKPASYGLTALEPYLAFANVPIAKPARGQALIRVALAGVNPSDIMFIKGLYGRKRVRGDAAGFEGVGTVVAVNGAEADRLVGRRVAFTADPSGAWAEYAVAGAAQCIPLADEVRDEDGAGFIVNPLTALALLARVRQEGEKAFVLTAAASQLGKLLIAAAAGEGYRPVAIVRRASQIEPLLAAGAAHALDSTAADFSERAAEVCREEKPRLLLDATAGPVPGAIFTAMPLGARWVVYGRLDPSLTTIPEPGQLIFQDKRIEGFWLAAWLRAADPGERSRTIADAQARFADGRWRTDVTAIVPLDEAFARLPWELAKPDGKVFLKP